MITLVAAVAKNRVIGKGNNLVWRNKEDMARFKAITSGPDKTVLMGRKTWESIPEKFRPLPGRKNVVITRSAEYKVPDEVICFDDLETALVVFGKQTDLYVIGGGEIYSAAMSHADLLEITAIDQDLDGDVLFPEIDPALWMQTGRNVREGFAFMTYARIR